jgi:hypothetical protein
MLVPVKTGFEVYLRDTNERDLSLSAPEPTDLLTVRQRFTLAHEIAHTFFFRLSESAPVPVKHTPSGIDLERFCDRGAGKILVPADQLSAALETYDSIDTATVIAIARRFRVSVAVTLERLAQARPANPMERCVILAQRNRPDAEIRTVYFGVGLLKAVPRPRPFTSLSSWLKDFPCEAVSRRGAGRWVLPRPWGRLELSTRELTATAFLLQIDSRIATDSSQSSCWAGG